MKTIREGFIFQFQSEHSYRIHLQEIQTHLFIHRVFFIKKRIRVCAPRITLLALCISHLLWCTRKMCISIYILIIWCHLMRLNICMYFTVIKCICIIRRFSFIRCRWWRITMVFVITALVVFIWTIGTFFVYLLRIITSFGVCSVIMETTINGFLLITLTTS